MRVVPLESGLHIVERLKHGFVGGADPRRDGVAIADWRGEGGFLRVRSEARRLLPGLVFLFLACIPVARAHAQCAQDAIARAAQQVQQSRELLLSIRVKDDDAIQVPTTAQRGIVALKNRIAALADAYMGCAPARVSPADVARDLDRLAHANAKPISDSQAVNVYGDQLQFAVKAPSTDRIAIVATFDIACGDDAVLLIYESEGTGWREALRWQSNGYDTVAGGLWSFDYAVSPPDKSGQWFVAVKSVAPWCSSTWSEIRTAILRPGESAAVPKILGKHSDSIWWGADDVGTVSVTRDSADFRFHAESIDDGVHNRLWIRHFHVTGDTVERMQPVAVSPRDFVDAWIVSPWSDAEDWSLATQMTALHAAHEIAQGEKKDEGFEFSAVQRCTDGPDRYQITLAPMDESKPSYFQVRGTPAAFTMLSVDRVPSHACAGQNILATMATR